MPIKPLSRYLLAAFCAAAVSPALSAKEPLFYRGDFDDKIVEAPNGALVNADYLDWVQNGPFGEPSVIEVRKGVWSIVGLSLSNYNFVETDNGLIAFDSGNNIGMGKQALELIRTVTDKPVLAIIYSHNHYTGGTVAYKKLGGSDSLTVFGHPKLDSNMLGQSSALNAARMRRGAIQFGFYMPHDGPDAAFGIEEPTYDDPALNQMGHVPVNRPVKDGEVIEFDGVKMVFHHIIADTDDSLLVHFPEHDMVMHNTMVIPFLYSLYTLRGEYYRDPEAMIPYIDLLRDINPKYTVGAHGNPITSRDEGYAIATAHRDAYAFVYQQSIRAINKGMTPQQMADSIRLPRHLAEHPWLFPAYVDNEYNVRAQYRGIMGWWAEDTANLHPPTDRELGEVFIEGFGSSKKVIKAAQKAYKEKKYNLAAKLLSFVIAAEPGNDKAKQLKADALRKMAQTTLAGTQTRNFMLTHALHLEGKTDWTAAPTQFFGAPTLQRLMAMPPGTTIKGFETRIDPAKSANIEKTLGITFTDLQRSWSLQVRRGVAEVTEGKPDNADATLALPRELWAKIVLGETEMQQVLQSGKASIAGDPKALGAVLAVFD